MKGILCSLAISILQALGAPLKSKSSSASKPPFFILAGDSTTATQSSNGGGWGDGFLNTTLFNGASGHNYGHNGATTVSFRAGGDWANVLATVESVSADYHPFVTIQFGHNDQKVAANISVSQYTDNLEKFVAEVRDVDATPILVTPLSRRNYDNSTGHPAIIEDLADQTAATITAAGRSGTAVIDLNKASTAYLNAIGPEKAWSYNLNADDHTHLNVEGSVVFGGMVAELIQREFPELKREGFLRYNDK
ncbi:hypothetical protein N7532_000803 [Penicillium argentinense]|uniref:SGNH hydrolase-type esterase domain-containing protein n=1 Tax=Penicillium argentinense TaxID=1131581 RepID=A0A9W9G6F0_9EURO|nr:uncharacterized protein N7532_000803 [Penicillium argentinense]KAJ5112758.1 hypothetical protein N7532_000803 [Penicillium argentinense]